MKKFIILSTMAVSGLIAQSAKAQIGFHISLHLGGSPVYVAPQPAPVCTDDYYYLPDVEAYYSVPENCYYYNDGYNWVSAAYLPGAYRNYDWHTARRIEIREARPYLHSEVYRSRYNGIEHRDWNYRGDQRMYADRDYRDHGFENHGYARPNDHFDHNNYDRMRESQRDDHNFNRGNAWGNHDQQQNYDHGNGWGNRGQQQTQPQQNNDHGNGWGNRGQQQAQPQQNNNRGGFDNGSQHFAQNNTNEHSRPTRF